MIFVDLFCGIGGFSQSVISSGHEVLFAVDSDTEVLKVYNENMRDIKTICCDIPAEWDVLKKKIPKECVVHASPPSSTLLVWFLEEMKKKHLKWTVECDGQWMKPFQEKRKKVTFDYFVIQCSDFNVPHDSQKIIASNMFSNEAPVSAGKLSVMDHWLNMGVRPCSDLICFESLTRHVKSPCFEIKKAKRIYWKSEITKKKFSIKDVARLQTFPEDFDLSQCCIEMMQASTPVSLGLLIIFLLKRNFSDQF